MHLNAKTNEYASILGPLLDEIPKAVLAAIAVSALTQGGEVLSCAAIRVAKEWEVLHLNGIVPQKPARIARGLASQEEIGACDE